MLEVSDDMARARVFEGVYVPLVTPFRGPRGRDGINEESLRRLIDYLIEAGVSGLVPCGSTGGHFTMSHDEQHRVFDITIDQTNGRVPVIAHTGSNNPPEAVSLTRYAEDAGADGFLLISPYAVNAPQEGILSYYREIAEITELPVVIYNVPSRTARNIEVPTILELSRIDNITGIKEASGNLNQVMAIIEGTRARGREFSVLSGDDAMNFPIYCLGGRGGIIASGHMLPEAHIEMYRCVREGRTDRAREIHYALLPLVRALFSEPNPAPLQAALNLLGFEVGAPRPPLVPATERCRDRVRTEMERAYMTLGLEIPMSILKRAR